MQSKCLEGFPQELVRESIRSILHAVYLYQDMFLEEYLANHVKWFLQHHNGSVDKFKKSVEEMYGNRIINAKQSAKQQSMFLEE